MANLHDWSTEEVEAQLGRKLTWVERIGYWWSGTTQASDSGVMHEVGALSDYLAETPAGTAAADLVLGGVDAAEATADTVVKYRWFIYAALAAGVGVAVLAAWKWLLPNLYPFQAK